MTDISNITTATVAELDGMIEAATKRHARLLADVLRTASLVAGGAVIVQKYNVELTLLMLLQQTRADLVANGKASTPITQPKTPIEL